MALGITEHLVGVWGVVAISQIVTISGSDKVQSKNCKLKRSLPPELSDPIKHFFALCIRIPASLFLAAFSIYQPLLKHTKTTLFPWYLKSL